MRRSLLTHLTATLAVLGCLPASAGDDALRWPEKKHWRNAAVAAARDRATWIPLSLGVAVRVGGWDEGISRWAVESTPVFGSSERASRAGDTLLVISYVGMTATALSLDAPWKRRGSTLLVENAAMLASDGFASLLKSATDRERPDGSDTHSFPSGHASKAFAIDAATSANLDELQLSRGTRRGLGITFEALAAGTAWARVESGAHYPSDVLAGAALGNFVARLFHEAFLGTTEGLALHANVHPGHAYVGVRIVF